MMPDDTDIIVQRYGQPLLAPLNQWWAKQEDMLVSITSSATASNGLGLERLSRMVADNPALIRTPVQARAALIGLFIAHGNPAGDAIGYLPELVEKPAPAGLHLLAALLLPTALRCTDADIPDPPPADLVSACLLAGDAQALDDILSSSQPPPRTINGLPWLHHAAITGKSKCLAVMLRHGANPHELDYAGNTALHNAGTPQVARMLMDAGVDATISNSAGHMPAQVWGQRTKDRARQEAMLSVLLSTPSNMPNPVESFFALAQSNNMGRLKSFARKLGVDYSIRHQDQGLVFNAALRLGREALKVTDLSPSVPQEARVASNWLGFLVEDAVAAQATTPIERQAVVAMADALTPSARPLINFRGPTPTVPGHLRHLVLALAASMPASSRPATGPSTQVRQGVQALFVGAIEQCLSAKDYRAAADAVHLANFAFNTAASSYLHKRLAVLVSCQMDIPDDRCDDLMLAASKSIHEATRHSSSNDIEGFSYLADMMASMRGPLTQTSQYIDKWNNSIMPDHKKKAIKPLVALVHAQQMRHSTPDAPRRPSARF